uniref:IS1 family transposase n=1 Tax=Serratia symbiotica TaxID=138074 RepID=UPI00396A8435
MACVNGHCPRCDSALVYRHGQNSKGQSRFRCRECCSVPAFLYFSTLAGHRRMN